MAGPWRLSLGPGPHRHAGSLSKCDSVTVPGHRDRQHMMKWHCDLSAAAPADHDVPGPAAARAGPVGADWQHKPGSVLVELVVTAPGQSDTAA